MPKDMNLLKVELNEAGDCFFEVHGISNGWMLKNREPGTFYVDVDTLEATVRQAVEEVTSRIQDLTKNEGDTVRVIISVYDITDESEFDSQIDEDLFARVLSRLVGGTTKETGRMRVARQFTRIDNSDNHNNENQRSSREKSETITNEQIDKAIEVTNQGGTVIIDKNAKKK